MSRLGREADLHLAPLIVLFRRKFDRDRNGARPGSHCPPRPAPYWLAGTSITTGVPSDRAVLVQVEADRRPTPAAGRSSPIGRFQHCWTCARSASSSFCGQLGRFAAGGHRRGSQASAAGRAGRRRHGSSAEERLRSRPARNRHLASGGCRQRRRVRSGARRGCGAGLLAGRRDRRPRRGCGRCRLGFRLGRLRRRRSGVAAARPRSAAASWVGAASGAARWSVAAAVAAESSAAGFSTGLAAGCGLSAAASAGSFGEGFWRRLGRGLPLGEVGHVVDLDEIDRSASIGVSSGARRDQRDHAPARMARMGDDRDGEPGAHRGSAVRLSSARRARYA